MDVREQQERLDAIAGRFAQIAPQGWARLVGNWEATPDEQGGPTLNYVTLAVVNGGDRWLLGQVGYDEPLYDLVAEFNAASADGGDERRWTVLDLEVDEDGSYRTGFGYETPKRTNGVTDHESLGRFESYLDEWVAQHGTVPGARS